VLYLGLTGTNAAGKTSLLEYLIRKGFSTCSLSDILRVELEHRQQPITRANLIQIGNELRHRFGAGVLAERIVQQLTAEKLVIDSIRNPSEIKVLRRLKNFFLLAIDAPIEIRFQRAILRQRNESATDLEAFRQIERLESSQDPNAQNIPACMAEADFKIYNDSSKENLYLQLEKVFEMIHHKHQSV